MLSGGEDNHLHRPDHDGAEPAPRVLAILSSVLERLVARNNQLVIGLSSKDHHDDHPVIGGDHGLVAVSSSRPVGLIIGKRLNGFHGVRAPNISIAKYLERIYKYTNCSPSCFVVGYVYIDRLLHKHPDSLLDSLNVHRLLLISVMIASKMLDDVHYNNAFYARVGGISNVELNKLELEFLFLLDFGVTVSSRVFESYCLHLEKEIMLSNGSGQQVERPPRTSNGTVGDETEISMEEDTQSSSPTQMAE